MIKEQEFTTKFLMLCDEYEITWDKQNMTSATAKENSKLEY